MLSKALFLLASGAALVSANSLGDAPVAGFSKAKALMAEHPVLHQYDPMAVKKYAVGPSQQHHHSMGPSQYHHHTSSSEGQETDSASTPLTLAVTRDGNSKPTETPTLALTRGQASSSASLSLDRQNPKFTSMPEALLGSSSSAGNDDSTKGHHGASKSWQPAGPSQYHHHPAGPSQYHHQKSSPYYSSTPDKMHYNNGNSSSNNPYYGASADKMHYNNGPSASDVGRSNPKAQGSGANAYMPYVEGGQSGKGDMSSGQGGAASAGGSSSSSSNNSGNTTPSDSSSNTNNNNNGDETNKAPQGWGASASARARMAEKVKHQGLYALYGQAAANACGMEEQMSGAEITACPLESGSGWDCLNLASTLESCGGCMSISEGQDCTMIKGAESVGCVHGKCIIGSCETGFYLDSDKGECVAN